MELWDLIFREYHDPKFLLDQVIPAGQFVEFLNTFGKKHEEKIRWEFYIHKLSAFDDRTWTEFNHDLDFGTARFERPSDDELEETVKLSYSIMKNFKLEGGD